MAGHCQTKLILLFTGSELVLNALRVAILQVVNKVKGRKKCRMTTYELVNRRKRLWSSYAANGISQP